MTEEELLKLTDEELLIEAKKMKSASMTHALLIGFSIGIIIYSAVNNSLGFLSLIPLFFIYKLFKGSKNYDALKKVLKERRLRKYTQTK